MPRISKRFHHQANSNVSLEKINRIAIYARLSSAQGENALGKASKDESIDVQIAIMKKFISDYQNNPKNTDQMVIFKIYTDLGKTGTNFQRSAFERLMQDIRLGDVNCVMVKDLSRFGRDYIEAGNYIEKIFPFLGVRFISVVDHFDTSSFQAENKRTEVSLKNLIHDLYAKEFSEKADIHLKQRRKKGAYVGGITPYGYTYSKDDRNRFFQVDEQTGPIVTGMFEAFHATWNINEVVRRLAAKRINPPKEYWKREEAYCPENETYKTWDRSVVHRILSSRTYIGFLEQGKSHIHGHLEENREWLAKKEWIVHGNHHPSLIDQKVFDEIQEHFAKKECEYAERKHLSRLIPMKENIFINTLVCGVCGRKLTRCSTTKDYADGSVKRNECFECRGNYRADDMKCVSNRISEERLIGLLMDLLEKELTFSTKKLKQFIAYNEQLAAGKKMEYEQKMTVLRKKAHAAAQIDTDAYTDYRSALISLEQYLGRKEAAGKQETYCYERMTELDFKITGMDKKVKEQNKIIRSIIQLKSSSIFTTELVDTLFEEIRLYPGKRIEATFKFASLAEKGADCHEKGRYHCHLSASVQRR